MRFLGTYLVVSTLIAGCKTSASTSKTTAVAMTTNDTRDGTRHSFVFFIDRSSGLVRVKECQKLVAVGCKEFQEIGYPRTVEQLRQSLEQKLREAAAAATPGSLESEVAERALALREDMISNLERSTLLTYDASRYPQVFATLSEFQKREFCRLRVAGKMLDIMRTPVLGTVTAAPEATDSGVTLGAPVPVERPPVERPPATLGAPVPIGN